MLADFLSRTSRSASPFELPDGVSAERAAVSPTQLGRALFSGAEVLRPRRGQSGLAATTPKQHG